MREDRLHELIEKVSKLAHEELMRDTTNNPTDDEAREIIENVVRRLSGETYISVEERSQIVNTVYNSKRKLDVLEPLLNDKSITEIMINGHDNIFIEQKGSLTKTDFSFESEEKLYKVIDKIVSDVGRKVNEANPIVDARLKDGSRVNAVVKPIALNGPILTIRKFPEKPFTIEQLIQVGSLPQEAAEFLQKLVKARYNMFISGGTGSGKTTFLNALSNFIPKDERIITIEDSAELQIVGVANLVKLETRAPNSEGKNGIIMRDLIKSSLRMRPDRIIVGEIRGAEALDMLQAMNTGHDGSLSTGHANSSKDMISRIETMVLTGAEFPLDAIRQQIASAIDIIIQLSRLRDKSRRTMEIAEVVGYEKGEFKLNTLYKFVEDGETPEGKVIGKLKRSENKMINTTKLQMAGFNIEQF